MQVFTVLITYLVCVNRCTRNKFFSSICLAKRLLQLENTVCLMARCTSVGIGGGNHTTTMVVFPHIKFPTLSPREVEW